MPPKKKSTGQGRRSSGPRNVAAPKKRKSITRPKTAAKVSKPISRQPREWDKANIDMDLTELQFRARSLGLPFGGLNKSQLVLRINQLR